VVFIVVSTFDNGTAERVQRRSWQKRRRILVLSLVLATACEGAGLNHHEKVKMRIVAGDFNFVVASACCDEDVRERGRFSCPVGEVAGLFPDFFAY
jgi:hypothetical protein